MLEHEQINDRAVSLTIRGAKLSGHVAAQAMKAMLRRMKQARDAPKIGNQSFKKLNRAFGGVSDNIEVMGRIKSFERIARKHQVSYHVERERDAEPPKYTVYFSGKQNGAVTAAFKEYTSLMLPKEKEKPSLLARLEKLIEKAKTLAAPARNRNRGEHEL
jgi:hypothetical protein